MRFHSSRCLRRWLDLEARRENPRDPSRFQLWLVQLWLGDETSPGQTGVTGSGSQHMGPISDAVAAHTAQVFQSQPADAASAAAGVISTPTMLPALSLLHQQLQYQSLLAPAAAERPSQRRRTAKCCCKLDTIWNMARGAPVVRLLILGVGLGSFTAADGIMTTDQPSDIQ